MSILSRINEIRDQAFASYGLTDTTPLSHHKLGFDKMHRRVYVEAEIRPEFLDRGDYPTELSMRWLGHNSVPGDCMLQLIDEKLGGPEHPINVTAFSSKVNMDKWYDSVDTIYDHLKVGGNRHAQMLYALEYDDENAEYFSRSQKIYYHFTLFENEQPVGEVMEEVIENLLDCEVDS